MLNSILKQTVKMMKTQPPIACEDISAGLEEFINITCFPQDPLIYLCLKGITWIEMNLLSSPFDSYLAPALEKALSPYDYGILFDMVGFSIKKNSICGKEREINERIHKAILDGKQAIIDGAKYKLRSVEARILSVEKNIQSMESFQPTIVEQRIDPFRIEPLRTQLANHSRSARAIEADLTQAESREMPIRELLLLISEKYDEILKILSNIKEMSQDTSSLLRWARSYQGQRFFQPSSSRLENDTSSTRAAPSK